MMKTYKLIKSGFLIALLFGASTVFAQPLINPVNTLETPVATACGVYDVNLSVQQYINVANISMTLDLNSLVAAGAYTGITLNPVIGSAITWINPMGQLKLSWSSDPIPGNALTLPDNTVLFTLHFNVNGLWGTSHDLAWDDVLTIDCELSGPNGYPIYPDYWNDLHWDIQNQLSICGVDITDYQCPLNPTGAIDLTICGGVPPYSYQWTGPGGFTANTQDISGLFPGDYFVTVTDADFCVVTGGPYTVSQIWHPGPREIGGPVPIASTVECASDAVPPTLPHIEDECGTVLFPIGPPVMGGTYVNCEGTITYTYTYQDYLGQQLVWTYTYTVEHTTPPAEVGGPVATASTVECLADAVPPALPAVEDVCGVALSAPNPVITDIPDPLTCEGTRTYQYTYTDCAGLTFVWTYTYTIEYSTPPSEVGNPVPTASTVECEADAVAPLLPVVEDVCGNVLAPDANSPVITYSPDPFLCEGTKIFTYTYTDCAGLDFVWVYTYTIQRSTPPVQTTFPSDNSIVECAADAIVPTPPVFEDVCGNVIPPSAAAPGGTYVDCEGTITYTFTFTDCANLSTDWVYTYNVVRSTPPGEIGGPAPTASTVECELDAIAPATLPVVKDVCGAVLTPTGPVIGGTYIDCEGTKTYTYTYTDCAGLVFVWVYTYTIEHSTPPAEVGNPVPTASTVECEVDAVEPAVLPVVEDVCGNVLPAPQPVMSSTVNCEGEITYTYTYTDCAGLDFVWVYTYTIEHSIPPFEVGGPVPTASTVECEADAVAPGTVYQAGFAGDFDPVNWSLINLGGVDGTVDVTGAPASITLTGGDNGFEGITVYETVIPINGTVAFNWNYTTTDVPGYDAFGYALNGVYYALTWAPGGGSFSINVTQGSTFGFLVYTVDGLFGPGVAITDAFLFKSPAFPVVQDVCGNLLAPVGPVISGTYVDCEGTIIYTYTYTDCAGLDFIWDYTYTILRVTPPAEVGGPAEIASTVECITDIVTPTLPVFEDVCGDVLTPTGPVMGGTYNGCEGTVTYTYTYTDCAGLFTEWVYTYTVDDTQAPWIIAPPDITVYMNDGCFATGIGLGAPQKGDNCQNQLFVTTDGLISYPEGTTIVTWTVTDCAGNSSFDTQLVTVIRNNMSGTLKYNNIAPFGPPKVMNNIDITLYNAAMSPLATVTTDNLGNYNFNGLCSGTYYVEITNINKLAGGVNTTDAGQVLTYGFSPYPVEKVRWLAGDADGSCFINIADVGKIVNEFVYAAGFAPNKDDWNFYWAGDINLSNACPALPMSVFIGGGNAVKDIFGMCTGDFNGNFSPSVAKSYSESLALEYGKNILVDANAEVELPLYAGTDMEVGAVSLIMNFPADEAEIIGVYLSSDPSQQVPYNVEGDELRIGWYSLAPVWLNKGESLITLQLKLNGETSAEGFRFSLAPDPLNELADGNYNVIGNASLTIDIPSTTALGAIGNFSAENIEFSNHPNPFKGTTTLIYNLPVDGKVVIEVYDLLGTVVKTVVNENQTAGQYSLKLNENSLQPGIYTAVLKLNSSDHEVMIRAIKMINK
jgi:hypothetical protein